MILSPFKLERYFAKYEFNTEFLLCSSDCESMTIADLLAFEEGAAEKFQNHRLGYTESLGSPSLRKEIAGMYATTQTDDILVFAGANEAIYLFMMAALKQDDHIIVHAPHYQSLSEVAKGIGCMVSPWFAREENGWALDMDELRHLMRPSTKAIVVNVPHNPTGYLMSRADIDALNKFVQENSLLLFSDEVYRESEYDPADRLPAAVDYGAHAVSLGVTSKTYGLAGLRIGWLATKNRDLYNKMASLKDYTTICNSAPSEFLAEVAMRHREKLANRNLEIIKHNLTIIDDLFTRHSSLFTWHRPKAGSMGFPKLLKGNVESFCDDLVKKAGVLLLPGSMYDETHNHFRLGLGRKNLPQAVERLETYLSQSKIVNPLISRSKLPITIYSMLRLTRPLHLLLAALTYLLGASIPAYLGKPFQPVPFAFGFVGVLLAQTSMSFLREVFRPHNEPLIEGETPKQKETLRSNLLYISAGMIGTTAVIAFIVHLIFTLTLPTFYFLLASLLLVLAYSIPPFHLVNHGFGELILALHIAYVIPSIGFLFQAGENSRLLTFLLIPLTVLALAYFLIMNFITFTDDQKYERGTLLRRLTWERAVPLHHSLVVFAYFMFALVPLFGYSFNLIAPAFLTLPFAIFQIFLLRAIANGNPPNWRLLTSTALAVFGLTTYFLTLTFWLR